MQIDFHYGVTKLIARAAGLSEFEAQTIAYAAQYTDDSVMHKSIEVEGLKPNGTFDSMVETWQTAITEANSSFNCNVERKMIVEGETPSKCEFDPICTAHAGIQKKALAYLKAMKIKSFLGYMNELLGDKAQSKVYIPFHFIPAEKYSSENSDNYNYCVKAGGPFPTEILDTIISVYKKSRTLENNPLREMSSVALGVSLHSYADTWAHEGFSGRKNSAENDIDDLYTSDDEYELQKDVGLYPNIGHLEANHAVDETHLGIKFNFEHETVASRHLDKTNDNFTVCRDNSIHFLKAAHGMYKKLCTINPNSHNQVAWSKIETDLFKVLLAPMPAKERIIELGRVFGEQFEPFIDFHYNPKQWEHEIVELRKSNGEYSREPRFVFHGNSRWFMFHVVSAVQRSIVQNSIKKFW